MSCPKCGDVRVKQDCNEREWLFGHDVPINFCPFCGRSLDRQELPHQEYMRKHPYQGPPLDGGAWTFGGFFGDRVRLGPSMMESYFSCRDCGRKVDLSERDERGFVRVNSCPDHPNTYLVAWFKYQAQSLPPIQGTLE